MNGTILSIWLYEFDWNCTNVSFWIYNYVYGMNTYAYVYASCLFITAPSDIDVVNIPSNQRIFTHRTNHISHHLDLHVPLELDNVRVVLNITKNAPQTAIIHFIIAPEVSIRRWQALLTAHHAVWSITNLLPGRLSSAFLTIAVLLSPQYYFYVNRDRQPVLRLHQLARGQAAVTSTKK